MREANEVRQSFGVGRVVDTENAGQVLLGEERRDRFIRREHELLDEFLGVAAYAGNDLDGIAPLVEQDLRLGLLEVERAAGAALLGEGQVQAVHETEGRERPAVFLRERGVFALFKQVVDLAVHTAHAAANDAALDRGVCERAVRGQLHQAREGVFVLPGVQRAGAVRERLRQHGDDLIGEVDAGAARE